MVGSEGGSSSSCLEICVPAKSLQSCLTLWLYGLYPARFLCPWDSGKNTVFRQEYHSGLPFHAPGYQTHVSYVSCLGRQVLYHQHHLGSPYSQIEHLLRILRARVVIWQNSAQNMGRWAAEIWWEFRLVQSPRNSGLYAWSSLPGWEKPRILGLGWGPETLQSVQLRLCSKGAAQS